jgi:hypothetical protein
MYYNVIFILKQYMENLDVVSLINKLQTKLIIVVTEDQFKKLIDNLTEENEDSTEEDIKHPN